MSKGIRPVGALILLVLATAAGANPISADTCGEPGRIATMTGADECAYAPYPGLDPTGTMSASDIEHFFPVAPDTWQEVGEVTDADGTDGYLTATSNEGWGAIPNSGSWAIDASFWLDYEFAVISMHVGGGQVAPDNWAWLMSDGATSGTWSLDFISSYCDSTDVRCNGGGLSNIKLWAAGEITRVAEPGTLALFGIGLLGLGLRRRRKQTD